MKCGLGSPKSEHATGVASMIGSYDRSGVPHHAAFGRPYFGNGAFDTIGQHNDNTCGPITDMISTYEWLIIENGVRIINESYRCGGSLRASGYIRDYFARYFDVLFVHAAGNLKESDLADNNLLSDPTVNCCGSNSLCVGAHDMGSAVLGGASANPYPQYNQQQAIAYFSKYLDPELGYGISDKRTDREEPDVVANGGLPSLHGGPTIRGAKHAIMRPTTDLMRRALLRLR